MRASRRSIVSLLALVVVIALSGGCSSSNNPEGGANHPVDIPATSGDYVVFVWNDLGMHCLNPTYDEAVLLPPYNTVYAQVVKRGDPPSIVTSGLSAEYRIVDNAYSYGKIDSRGGAFAGFWDNCQALFGVTLEHDTGLNLDTPSLHNSLSGLMVAKDGPPHHFQVNGIPVTPVNDAGAWNPYQVVEVTIKSGSTVVAQTRATVPTSDEINCGRAGCHAGGDGSVFHNILVAHDNLHRSSLATNTPVLCASCHGSPALGGVGPGSSGKYLSAAIHGAHASRGAVCLDCHPGETTKCNRSLAHTAADGNCTNCHGSMADVASSIEDTGRVPWVTEPKCVTCHTAVSGVDTGAKLYRDAWGHGGVYCAACHGSPHAMFPSREASDNYQPLHYQNSSKTIGSCGACHDNSRGGGGEEFGEEHGGTNGRPTACRVCHTRVPTDTTEWPHKYEWKGR
jgi:hypothetical protein